MAYAHTHTHAHTHTQAHARTHACTHARTHVRTRTHLLLILDSASRACIHAFLCSGLAVTRLRWEYFGPWMIVKHCSSGTSATACCITSVLRPARNSRMEAMSTAGGCDRHNQCTSTHLLILIKQPYNIRNCIGSFPCHTYITALGPLASHTYVHTYYKHTSTHCHI